MGLFDYGGGSFILITVAVNVMMIVQNMGDKYIFFTYEKKPNFMKRILSLTKTKTMKNGI